MMGMRFDFSPEVLEEIIKEWEAANPGKKMRELEPKAFIGVVLTAMFVRAQIVGDADIPAEVKDAVRAKEAGTSKATMH